MDSTTKEILRTFSSQDRLRARRNNILSCSLRRREKNFLDLRMKFHLNGIEKTFEGDPDLTLLKYLREHEYLISPKDGCSPQAACGACTVEIDGKAVLSCVTPMSKVAGCEIFTTEGLEELIKNALVVAFAEKGAVQCGFCTPGIVMRAKVLLQKNPDPSREEIIAALKNHLCRCTGYLKIIDAISLAAKNLRQRKIRKFSSSDAKVGSRHKRYDVERLIVGNRPFVADLRVDDMVYGAFKFSDHPRAQVISINTEKAEKVAGVIRVFTAEDIPGIRYIGLITADWPLMIRKGGDN